jgi:exodeoxyribonuclease V
MPEIKLSEDQEKAFEQISKWISHDEKLDTQKDPRILSLAGYAGTGKSFLISRLAKTFEQSMRFAFCTLSGKASSVLYLKLKEQGFEINDRHFCGTIHRLIYKPIENENGEVVYWAKKDAVEYDVIIIDEASMISEDIFQDLYSYNTKILAVGDHGQLPPIEGKFSIMQSPDIKLERIHRQAEGNPIIQLSIYIRENGCLPPNYKNNNNVSIVAKNQYRSVMAKTYSRSERSNLDNVILCYKNATRNKINTDVRKIIFGGDIKTPMIDDVVICLRNNAKGKQFIYNGFRGYLASVDDDDDNYICNLNFPTEDLKFDKERLCKYQFGHPKTFSSFSELEAFDMWVTSWADLGLLFDYGYAITVHKSQGSQFDNVIIFNERPFPVDDDTYKRWLYTATTRSSNKLTIIK